MATLLEANEVTKIYAKGQRPSLNKVSFNVAESEFIAIMGASGSGKTTLLNVLSTIDTPTSGSIVINGVNLKQLSDTGSADFRRDNLGFIFQEYFLLDSLTIRENISVPLTLQKLPHKKIEKMVRSLAERFGIASQLDKYPNELSGGQRQRASAARAIVKQPNILFADEPTGGAEKVGLEEIHAYALKDATMGQYESRRGKVYEAVKGSSLADVSNTKTEEKENTSQKPQSTPTGVSKGDIVTFTGGGVYKSSTADHASVEKDVVSTCKVTAINTKGTHPYHCISQDGKGIYGWVNKEDVK